MTNKLQKFLDSLIERQKDYDNPMSYQEEEYYDACQAKSKLLEELIDEVKSLIKETENENIF